MTSSHPLRVVLLGAESSGKTTMTKALAKHYASYWVPEYWRFYWDAKHLSQADPIWTSDEFLHIAALQNQLADHYASLTRRILFCDTDAFATAIWHFRYLQFYTAALEPIWQSQRRDLVFLCTPDIAFVQDGVRDGEAIRASMTDWIRNRLIQSNIAFVELKGTHEQRLQLAMDKVEALLRKNA